MEQPQLNNNDHYSGDRPRQGQDRPAQDWSGGGGRSAKETLILGAVLVGSVLLILFLFTTCVSGLGKVSPEQASKDSFNILQRKVDSAFNMDGNDGQENRKPRQQGQNQQQEELPAELREYTKTPQPEQQSQESQQQAGSKPPSPRELKEQQKQLQEELMPPKIRPAKLGNY